MPLFLALLHSCTILKLAQNEKELPATGLASIINHYAVVLSSNLLLEPLLGMTVIISLGTIHYFFDLIHFTYWIILTDRVVKVFLFALRSKSSSQLTY